MVEKFKLEFLSNFFEEKDNFYQITIDSDQEKIDYYEIFGETGMDEYPIVDDDGYEWTGVKPKFTKEIKDLNSKEILVQGYMFPLEQDEKQSLFLLGPFPLSCPYHPHTSSNLLIEVHSNKPIVFSYDPVNIKGKLELVPRDDEYNVFYRLRNAELVLQ